MRRNDKFCYILRCLVKFISLSSVKMAPITKLSKVNKKYILLKYFELYRRITLFHIMYSIRMKNFLMWRKTPNASNGLANKLNTAMHYMEFELGNISRLSIYDKRNISLDYIEPLELNESTLNACAKYTIKIVIEFIEYNKKYDEISKILEGVAIHLMDYISDIYYSREREFHHKRNLINNEIKEILSDVLQMYYI